MRPDFYFNIDLLSTIVCVNDAARPIVVISRWRWASATGFLTSFHVETMMTVFLPILIGDIVARSGRFEEAVCLYGRRDGKEGKQECHQTD